MSLVEAYIFRIVRSSFLVALGVLTAVIWITQALKEFDLLTTKGQTLLVFLGVTALGLPALVMVIAPIALFIAVLYTLNKLNGDSELIVMSAAGVSPMRLLKPFAILTVLVTLLVGGMSLYAMPWSFRELRDLVMKIRADFITHVVREGTFTTLDQGFIFHYRERGPDGSLHGILMEDRRDPDHISSYVADSGQTWSSDDNNYLVLNDGSVQRHQPGSKDAAIVAFQRYALDLAQFGAEGAGAPLRPRERSTRELLNPDMNDADVRFQAGRYRSELHDRFSGPLYALAFGMIAFAALSQPRTTRSGNWKAMASAFMAVAAVRGAGFAASGFVVKSAAWIPADYAVPGIGLAGALLYIFAPRISLPRRRAASMRLPVAQAA